MSWSPGHVLGVCEKSCGHVWHSCVALLEPSPNAASGGVEFGEQISGYDEVHRLGLSSTRNPQFFGVVTVTQLHPWFLDFSINQSMEPRLKPASEFSTAQAG